MQCKVINVLLPDCSSLCDKKFSTDWTAVFDVLGEIIWTSLRRWSCIKSLLNLIEIGGERESSLIRATNQSHPEHEADLLGFVGE